MSFRVGVKELRLSGEPGGELPSLREENKLKMEETEIKKLEDLANSFPSERQTNKTPSLIKKENARRKRKLMKRGRMK